MLGIIKLKTKDNKAIKIEELMLNVPDDTRKFLENLKIGDKVDFGYYDLDQKKYLKYIKSANQTKPSSNVTMDSLFTQYKKYNWSILPIANNEKIPVEENWSKLYEGKGITHYEIDEWKDWLKNGFKGQKKGKPFTYKNINLGLRTGKVSGNTVIDVDDTKLTVDVDLSKTLYQITRAKHYHLVYQYDPDLNLLKGNKKLQAELKIDIRNDGNQVLIEPSTIDGKPYKWVNLGQEITPIPKELKEQLMSYVSKNKIELPPTPEIIIPELVVGQRSNTLMSLGGILRNRFSAENTAWILNLLHKQICEEDPKNPLGEKEIYKMVQSLVGYKQSDEQTLKDRIHDWAKMYENDFTARDLMESLTLSNRGIVDKGLSELVKEGRMMRLSRGVYRYRERVDWKTGRPDKGIPITIKIPYFNHIQSFESGDIILIGGMPGRGKTHIAMNIIKQLIDQGISPYYLHKEPQSRFQKIGDVLKTDWTKFQYFHHSNPLSVQLEKDAFTILDYLHIRDKSLTDSCLGYLNDEMVKKGGILFLFVQLKKNGEYFAPNMIDQSPAFACRYLYDDDTKISGHFEIDKIREPRGENEIRILPCVFNKKTKILKIKEDE